MTKEEVSQAVAMSEQTCATCANFQPNGGVLKMGYCRANKWAYRKPSQHCRDKYTPGVPNDSDGQANEALRLISKAIDMIEPNKVPVYTQLELF